MTDDRTPDPATPGQVPAAPWDRHEMETDRGGSAPDATTEEQDQDAPIWNLGQMEGEHADGSGGPSTAEDIDAPGGLSGGGVNPGGGERWADRDRER